jgi:mannose/fructose-specific phosphotransferase system component IIA
LESIHDLVFSATATAYLTHAASNRQLMAGTTYPMVLTVLTWSAASSEFVQVLQQATSAE